MPFIELQIIMVVAGLMYPGMVTHYKARRPVVDAGRVEINTPSFSNFERSDTGAVSNKLKSNPATTSDLNDLFN